jgi:secreted PhoX family phosphatase
MRKPAPETPSGPLELPRRRFLRSGLTVIAAALVAPRLVACGDDDGPGAFDAGMGADGGAADASVPDFPMRVVPARPDLVSRIAEIGPLEAVPDANGLRLPAGFTGRVLARSGEPVAGTDYTWHTFPDGGATFATEDGGWVYVSNSEVPVNGGVGAVRFAPDGTIRSAYRTLQRTRVNCAGGPTPWHTWLSCEEIERGRVWETDPWGEVPAVVRPALGTFKHEAVAVDDVRRQLYLTEDEPDGCLYRFVPARVRADGRLDLTEGRLEVAVVADEGGGGGAVTWREVPDPTFSAGTPTRMQVPGSTVFRGGEGIWYFAGTVYFSTKGDNRVWAYDVVSERVSVLYDAATAPDPILRGVDNITLSATGDVLVAEDGDDMQIVAILPDGGLRALVQVVGQDGSEITGPAFDPSGTRLYFSSQRGGDGGITYEITGPFHAPR